MDWTVLDGEEVVQHVRDAMVPASVIAAGPQLAALGVSRLGVFGSVVRGEARSDSDLDVLITAVDGVGVTLIIIRAVIPKRTVLESPQNLSENPKLVIIPTEGTPFVFLQDLKATLQN